MLRLILLGGAAGTGKSSLSKCLVDADLVILGKERLTRGFTEELLQALGCSNSDRESDTYLEHVRPLEYQILQSAGLACLEKSQSVLLEAPWLKEITSPLWIDNFRDMTEALGAEPFIVWLVCDSHENYRRLSERAADRDLGKLSNWTEYAESSFATHVPTGIDLVLNTTHTTSEALSHELLTVLEI